MASQMSPSWSTSAHYNRSRCPAPGPETIASRTSTAQHGADRGNRGMPGRWRPQPTSVLNPCGRPGPRARRSPATRNRARRHADRIRGGWRRSDARRRVAAPGRCAHQAGRTDAEDAQCQVQQRGAELQRRRGRGVRGPEPEGERHLGQRRPDRRRHVRRRAVRAPGPQRARRRGPHPGHARQPAQAQRCALHDLPRRQGRLGAARQRHRYPPARRTRLSAAACGWTSRACRSSTRPSSPFRSATSASPASCFRRSAPLRAAARRCRCRGTGTSRRTTTRRSCRRGISKRGGKLDSEFRYLSDLGRGSLEAEYLPDDQEFGDSRSYVHFIDRSDFTDTCGSTSTRRTSSDSALVRGLRPRPGRHEHQLPRTARPASPIWTQHWLAVLRAQNFQTIDDIGIPPELRPHTLLPQLAVHAGFPDQLAGLQLGLDLEVGDFAHNYEDLVTTGLRAWTSRRRFACRCAARASTWSRPLAGATRPIELDDTGPLLADDSPSRAAPIASVDGGLIFERPSGSRKQRLQTLEPRFMYLYVPFRNQDTLPVFDTGAGRSQSGAAVPHQSLRRRRPPQRCESGQRRRHLAAARRRHGQAVHLRHDRPGVLLRRAARRVAGRSAGGHRVLRHHRGARRHRVRQLERAAWACSGIRTRRARKKATCRCSTSPTFDRVVNVGYRFRRGSIEQVDGSLAWPIGKRLERLRAPRVFARGQTSRWISSRAWNTAPAAGGSAPSRAAT